MAPAVRSLRDAALYYPFRALLAVGGSLPPQFVERLGRGVGRLALGLDATDRRRVRRHLRCAFPELESKRERELVAAVARHMGRTLGEVFWLWNASSEAVAKRCTIEGVEHLERARAAGRGAVLVTGHCGNWELLNARLGVAGVPMTVAVREIYDPRLQTIATGLRSRFGGEVVPRGEVAGRRLVAALLRNRVAGLLIDQDIREIAGVFVPFFGTSAWTPSGAGALADRIGCPVVPAFIHRLPDGRRHHVVVHPPLPAPQDESHEQRVWEITAQATAAIERQVRGHPDQWVWMHRRWRTRPPEEGPSSGPARAGSGEAAP